MNSENNINSIIETKFNRFKLYILDLTKNPNEYINRLRGMNASGFLAAAQLLIETHNIKTVEQFGEEILNTTGLAEAYDQVDEPTQLIIRNYCCYFYEILAVINKK